MLSLINNFNMGTIDLLWKGMLAIFIVMVVIMLVVNLMNYISAKINKKSKKND
jgi:amino acid transporter